MSPSRLVSTARTLGSVRLVFLFAFLGVFCASFSPPTASWHGARASKGPFLRTAFVRLLLSSPLSYHLGTAPALSMRPNECTNTWLRFSCFFPRCHAPLRRCCGRDPGYKSLKTIRPCAVTDPRTIPIGVGSSGQRTGSSIQRRVHTGSFMNRMDGNGRGFERAASLPRR